MLSFEGNLLTQRHEICSQETRLYAIARWKPVSVSHLGLVRYQYRWMDKQNYDS